MTLSFRRLGGSFGGFFAVSWGPVGAFRGPLGGLLEAKNDTTERSGRSLARGLRRRLAKGPANFVLHWWSLDRDLLWGGPLRGLFARPAPSDADALVVVVSRGGDVGGGLGDP
jgi:hypothetical protein